MVILHIAHFLNEKFSGVSLVVPQHVLNQGKYAQTALINTTNTKVSQSIIQFDYAEEFDINSLPTPFNAPDLVIFHETYRIEYIKIYKNLLKNKVKYIILPHGELSKHAQKKKWLKKKIANILIFNRFIRHALSIQCLSHKEMLDTKFNVNKFVGTNGTILPSEFNKKETKDSLKFVYVGRLDAYAKGLDLMIEAFSKEKDFLIQNNCKLYIYGPDYNGRFNHLKELIEDNDGEDVISLNHEVFDKDKTNILFDTDVFVQTSRVEGMPLGILEALSYSIPVLITSGTNLKKEVEKCDGGWTADGNVESIMEAIEKAVFEKEQIRNKGFNGRNMIESTFAWEAVSKECVEKYKELISYNAIDK